MEETSNMMKRYMHGELAPDAPKRPNEAVTKAIEAVNGLSVNPKYSFDNCPQIDILIVPGGFGTRKLIHNAKCLQCFLPTTSRKLPRKRLCVISLCFCHQKSSFGY